MIGPSVLLLVCMALAPEGVQERLDELGTLMRSERIGKTQRLDALDERLALRGEALDAGEFANDAERTRWRIDQAEDMLMGGLGFDRLGLVVLHGHPTARQSMDARSRIDAALSLLDESSIEVEQGIFELEQVRASNRSSLQREMLLHYREKERDRRLPFLRAMALVHRAEAYEDGDLRTRTMREALDSVEGLDERLDGASSARASWLRGLALARLGRYEEAEEAFRTAAVHPSATPDIVLAARLGGVVNREVQGGVTRAVRAANSLLDRYEGRQQVARYLLIVDCIANLHSESGRLEEASAAWNGMRPDLVASGFEPDAVDAIIADRIRMLPIEDPSATDLPLAVLLAHASREDIDAGKMAESIQSHLAEPGIEHSEKARAMLVLGSLLVRSDRPFEAASILHAMAVEHPGHSRSGPAIEQAARLAVRGHLSNPSDADWRQLSDAVLDHLLSGYPDLEGIDAWRLAAARMAARDGRVQDSLVIYDTVSPGAGEYESAIVEGAVQVLSLSRGEAPAIAPGDAVESLKKRRSRGNETTQVAVDLLMVEALIDDQRAEEAAALVKSLDERSLDETQRSRIETLRLRCAAGDPAAMAAAASTVAGQRRPEGGVAIASALRDALARLSEVEQRTGVEHAQSVYRDEVLPLAEAMQEWLGGMNVDDPEAGLLVVEGLRKSGRHAEAIEFMTGSLSDRRDSGQVLFERAECLHALGSEDQLAEAMGIYRRLSRVEREQAPRRWWWSQLRMLETLSLLDRNVDQIAPRIRQLLAEDDSLGGADIRRRFENLLARHQ